MERILFTAPRFHTNQHYPVKALLEAGHKVAFFALRRGGSEEYSALNPVVLGHSCLFEVLNKVLNPKKSDAFVIKYAFPPIWRFWNEVMRFKPTIVIIRGPNTPYGIISIMAAKAVGAKVVFYTQGPLYRKMGFWGRWVRSFFPAVFGAQWITPVLGDPKIGIDPPKRWHYVPFVVEPGTPPDKKIWFRGNAINILSIGKFEPRKNHILLLKAIRKISETFPVRLTIIGECTTPKHRSEFDRVSTFVKKLNLGKIVSLKVNLAFSEVQKTYPLNDLYVLPSRNEPAAVSILEAMAHSLPVICSSTCATKCYIEEGRNGYVFESDDLDDLTRKIRLMIADRNKLVTMGKYSYSLVLERHAPSMYVKTITSILRSGSG